MTGLALAALKIAAKVAVRYGPKLVALAIKAVKDLAPVVKATMTYLAAHKTIAVAIGAYVIGKNSEDIFDYLREKSIAQDIIDGFKEATSGLTDKQANELKRGALAVEKHITENSRKNSSNHPVWWFNGTKVTYYDDESKGLNADNLLTNLIHRRLYLDTGVETLVTGWTHPTFHDDIYALYRAYYDRMAMDPPNNQTTVITHLGKILSNSFWMVAKAIELRRKCDMKEAKLLGSAAAAQVLMPYDAIDAMRIRQTRDYADGDVVKEFRAARPLDAAGFAPDWNPGETRFHIDGARPKVITADDDISATHIKFPSISNKVWNELVGSVQTAAYLTDHAYEFAKWMFDGVFIDSAKEDRHEMYSFSTPPILHDSTASQYVLTAVDVYKNELDQIHQLIAQNMQLINADKAYLTVLACLGVCSSVSYGDVPRPEWKDDFKEAMTRDQLSQTLKLYSADDSLYNALLNAEYRAFLPYSNSQDEFPFARIAIATHESGADGKSRGVVYTGPTTILADAKDIKSVYSRVPTIPEPKQMDAGTVASAWKFRGQVFALVVGPVSFLPGPGENVKKPVLFMNPWWESLMYNNPQYAIIDADFLINAGQIYTNGVGLLPFGMTYRSALVEQSPDITWPYFDINNVCAFSKRVEVFDPSIVLEYQYPNLLTRPDYISPMVKKLSDLKVTFATL